MDLVKSRLLRGTNHSLDRDLRKLSGTTSTLARRTHERKKPQAPAPTNSKPRRWYDRIIPHPNDPRHAKILSLPKTPHSPNERDYEIARPPATLKFRTQTAVFPGFPTIPGRRIGARERSPRALRSGTASSRRGAAGTGRSFQPRRSPRYRSRGSRIRPVLLQRPGSMAPPNVTSESVRLSSWPDN
jgi:hypothetical protein